jgi:alpha-beta hydrolase superfamily lysophospholipase
MPDGALDGFECTTIPLPSEDDGELAATVIRKRGADASRRAFLYVHGFVDYFFHEHVAHALVDAGWDFYAVELRRHGRSLRAGNRPNYCTSLAQYDTEISAAIAIIREEDGQETVVMYGHSTGALVTSLYADSGARRADIKAVVLNSPFFDFNVSGLQRLKLPVAVAIGGVLPWLSDPKAISPRYAESIHATLRGEWNYDLRWKPVTGFPAYFGWVRAISIGHAKVQKGLAISCPVLVLHSDKSGGGDVWDENFHTRDIVLNVAHMRAFSSKLGPNVLREEIPDAIHDVMLSRVPVRTNVLRRMLGWLQQTIPATSSQAVPSPKA